MNFKFFKKIINIKQIKLFLFADWGLGKKISLKDRGYVLYVFQKKKKKKIKKLKKRLNLSLKKRLKNKLKKR